ncbi:MAG: hypothetical protein ACOYH4_02060 [Saccharofermentanales bacterium]|jgi:hypothetical protein
MDYLEGFLIGPVWSDTDYQSRRHVSAHVFLATVMAALFVVFVIFPNTVDRWIWIDWPWSLILLIAAVLLTPVLSANYYRWHAALRPIILLLYAFKYVLLFYVLVHIFLPMTELETASLPALVYARMDNHITVMLEKIASGGGILATVAGVLVGGLWVVAEVLLILLILIAVPLAAIMLFKCLQWLIDYGVYTAVNRAEPTTAAAPASPTDAPEPKPAREPARRVASNQPSERVPLTDRAKTRVHGWKADAAAVKARWSKARADKASERAKRPKRPKPTRRPTVKRPHMRPVAPPTADPSTLPFNGVSDDPPDDSAPEAPLPDAEVYDGESPTS